MFEENLVEVIKDGQIMRVSKAEAEKEDLFVLNTPSNESFSDSSSSSGETLDLTAVKKPSDKREVRDKVLNSLVENFHWKIVRVRREKNMSRKQLAEKIGESEEVVKALEYGDIPKGNFAMVTKVEEVLGIKLKKEGGEESFNAARKLVEREQAARQAREREKQKKEKQENATVSDLFGDDIEIVG